MSEQEKFHPTRLGDTYKDPHGKKWRLKAYTDKPTIILESERGEEVTVTVDSGFARALNWYRQAGSDSVTEH